MKKVKQLLAKKDYPAVIEEVRKEIKKDIRAFSDPDVKVWCGHRWRNIFITEAIKDPVALKVATEKKLIGKDKRPDRQKISERFLRLDGPSEWQAEMPEAPAPTLKKVTLVFCPGLLSGLLPVMAFQEAFPEIERKYKTKILQSDSHPMRGCEANTEDILNILEKGIGMSGDAKLIPAAKAIPPKDVFLICYSKGMPDLLTTLVKRPNLKKRIRCIFNWAGAPGGSPLADNIYNSIKDTEVDIGGNIASIIKVISPVINLSGTVRRIQEYRIKDALQSLSTEYRQEFLNRNLDKIDKMNIPIFNLTGSTTVTEVPYFQMQGVMELNKFDANNDMQVTQNSAKITSPMATDLAMLHGHHWDLSYSPFPKKMRFGSSHLDHPFPKEAAATAMIQLGVELGILD